MHKLEQKLDMFGPNLHVPARTMDVYISVPDVLSSWVYSSPLLSSETSSKYRVRVRVNIFLLSVTIWLYIQSHNIISSNLMTKSKSV